MLSHQCIRQSYHYVLTFPSSFIFLICFALQVDAAFAGDVLFKLMGAPKPVQPGGAWPSGEQEAATITNGTLRASGGSTILCILTMSRFYLSNK